MSFIYMTKMLLAIVMAVFAVGCGPEDRGCYALVTIMEADSATLAKRAPWVTETVRAASQNMTGGDYEDADATIRQAEKTASHLFPSTTMTKGMVFIKDDNRFFGPDGIIRRGDMDSQQLAVFDSLSKYKISVDISNGSAVSCYEANKWHLSNRERRHG